MYRPDEIIEESNAKWLFLQYATSKDKIIYDIIHLNFAVYDYLHNTPNFQLGSYYDSQKNP